MKITYGGIVLCDWHTPILEPIVDGLPLVEVVPIVGADYQRIFGRGNRVSHITFSVSREHASLLAAQRWMWGFAETLPDRADASIIIGHGATTEAVELPVCSARVQIRVFGVRTYETYTITAPRIAITGPILTPSTVMTISRVVSITASASSVAVIFPQEFPSPPVVTASVIKPNSAGDNIWANPVGDTITTTGCTIHLSGPTPAAGYKLAYSASF